MMDNPTRSPRRQHILSSINPETEDARERSPKRHRRQRRSHSREDGDEARTRNDDPDDKTRPRRSRLRLKDEKSRHHRRRHRSRSTSRASHRERPRSRSRSPSSRSRRHRHRHHDRSPSHRHHRRRHRSPTPPNPHQSPPLDPEAAFRESLFDAMADDEGAAYWEGVYGQPIHIYEEEYANSNGNGEGSLERMSEEEYAAYVRQKMWEKTNAGLLEERARREQMRKEKEEKKKRERELHDEAIRAAQREDEQRFKRRWQKRFQEYLTRWADVPTTTQLSSSRPRPSPETILPWPVDSGRREDICESAVRTFFIRGLNAADIGEQQLAAKLKEERVRWHPDKIQQRLGGEVEEVVMKEVTAIFQTVDKMWAEVRGKA